MEPQQALTRGTTSGLTSGADSADHHLWRGRVQRPRVGGGEAGRSGSWVEGAPRATGPRTLVLMAGVPRRRARQQQCQLLQALERLPPRPSPGAERSPGVARGVRAQRQRPRCGHMREAAQV